jgi:hypothetical protein
MGEEYEVEIPGVGRRRIRAGDPAVAAASAVREFFEKELAEARDHLPPIPQGPIRVSVFRDGKPCGEFDVTVTITGWGSEKPTVRTEVAPAPPPAQV